MKYAIIAVTFAIAGFFEISAQAAPASLDALKVEATKSKAVQNIWYRSPIVT